MARILYGDLSSREVHNDRHTILGPSCALLELMEALAMPPLTLVILQAMSTASLLEVVVGSQMISEGIQLGLCMILSL